MLDIDLLGDEYDAYRADDDAPVPTLTFRETDNRLSVSPPETKGRVDGAPQVVFPRRESRLAYAAFSLSDIPDGDAQAAGARFIREVPTFIYRDALEATRSGDDVTITRVPLANEEAQQTLTSPPQRKPESAPCQLFVSIPPIAAGIKRPRKTQPK